MVKKIPFIILLLLSIQSLFAQRPQETKTTESAIDFNLLDLDNRMVSLSDFSGKALILFFWTTWCPFCQEELKKLDIVYPELKNEGELLAINVGESFSSVERFIRKNPVKYKVVLDRDMGVAKSYGIIGVPTYIFIDKKGHIIFNSHYFIKEYKELILQ